MFGHYKKLDTNFTPQLLFKAQKINHYILYEIAFNLDHFHLIWAT